VSRPVFNVGDRVRYYATKGTVVEVLESTDYYVIVLDEPAGRRVADYGSGFRPLTIIELIAESQAPVRGSCGRDKR